MSPCPNCLFCYFGNVLASLHYLKSSLFSVLPGNPPTPHTPPPMMPWWEQFPVGNMQTPQIHHRFAQRCSLVFSQRPEKIKMQNVESKICLTFWSPVSWRLTGNAKTVVSICSDRRYVNMWHAWFQSASACRTWRDVVKKMVKKERSVIHDFLYL